MYKQFWHSLFNSFLFEAYCDLQILVALTERVWVGSDGQGLLVALGGAVGGLAAGDLATVLVHRVTNLVL